jgi:hypothetical protein
VPPPRRVPQTDAIFEELKRVNPEADQADDTLRVSIDAKATVNIGPFSRRGRSRTGTEAADHDFKPEATLTPLGIFLPQHDDLWFYMARSKVTSDFIADRPEQWWEGVRLRSLRVKTLVINLDNGPENHSRRAQFLERIVEFARKYGTGWGCGWRTTRRTAASTTRSSVAGEYWRCTGMGRRWTRSVRRLASPGR